jgi:5-formyltetrahydrofolate cyclo-ligase
LLVTTKAELRREMRARVLAAPAEQAVVWSLNICDRLWERVAGNGGARVVMAYVPLPGEADIRGVVVRMLGEPGMRLCLPRVDWAAGRMSAARVERLSDLVEGRYGVMEPPGGAEEVPAGELDVILVPGLAFDACGNRLGRGAGFYDRFLGELRASPGWRGRVYGVAFDLQIVQDVPTDPWDQRLDAIATESRWMDVAR